MAHRFTRPTITSIRITAATLALAAGGLILGISALPHAPAAAHPGGAALASPHQAPPQVAINDELLLRDSEIISLSVPADPPADPGATLHVQTTVAAIAGNQPITLELWPHSVRAPEYRVQFQMADGSFVEVDPEPERTLRGRVLEVPGSKVAASLLNGGLSALLILPDDHDLHWIEPLATHFPDGGFEPDLHVAYTSSNVDCEPGNCGLGGALVDAPGRAGRQSQQQEQQDGSGSVAGLVCETVLLAADIDFNFVQIWGGSQQALNRVNNILNNVNAIYEDQVAIIHLIGDIIVRTTNAPYNCPSNNSAGNLLTQFVNTWTSAPESQIPRDVAHLFTGCTSINAAGIAQLGGANVTGGTNFGVCRPNHYGLSIHLGTISCASHVTAHELGHNWSAQHCDGTSGCSGTIMPATFPPCSTVFNTFSTNQILNHKNSSHWGACTAPCLVPPPNDTCQSSIVIGLGSTPFTNVNASTDGPLEPDACGVISSAIESDIWYAHSAQCTGTMTVSLCDSSPGFDTKLALYHGFACPTGPGTAVACNKDSCGQLSSISVPVVQGHAWRIRIGGHNGAQGTGTLTITCEPDPEPDLCPADLNGDGEVNVFDLLALLEAWGPCDSPTACPADITGDGNVDVFDLLALLEAWGPCP